MGLTVLTAQNDNVKSVKVRIIADTVLSRDGRGVPIYTGSVLNVTPSEANLLFASVKAERAKPDEEENVILKKPSHGTNPKAPIK